MELGDKLIGKRAYEKIVLHLLAIAEGYDLICNKTSNCKSGSY